MKFTKGEPHRRSIRIKEYDYSQAGAYFVTLCAWNRECLFGAITMEEMHLNQYGAIVFEEWGKTGVLRPNVYLNEFVIIPNHFHTIIGLTDDGGFRRGTASRAPTTEQFGKPTIGTVPTIMRSFKSAVTKHANELRRTPGVPVWQRNYYEHVIRSEMELNRIRKYIVTNPAQWGTDQENPDAHPKSIYYDVAMLDLTPVGTRRAVPIQPTERNSK